MRRNTSGDNTGLPLLCRESGLTLLELIVSMTILGIMMAIIMGSFRLGSRAWEKGETKAGQNQKTRIILDNFLEEIRSAASLHIVNEEEIKYHAFWGDAERIRFITTASGLSGAPGLNYTRAVSYYAAPDTGLVMKSTPCFGGDCFAQLDLLDETVIDAQVSRIRFRYAYRPEPEEGEDAAEPPPVEWVADWDPTTKEAMFMGMGMGMGRQEEQEKGPPVQKLPLAVEVTVTVEREEKTTHLPPIEVPIYLGQEIFAPKDIL